MVMANQVVFSHNYRLNTLQEGYSPWTLDGKVEGQSTPNNILPLSLTSTLIWPAQVWAGDSSTTESPCPPAPDLPPDASPPSPFVLFLPPRFPRLACLLCIDWETMTAAPHHHYYHHCFQGRPPRPAHNPTHAPAPATATTTIKHDSDLTHLRSVAAHAGFNLSSLVEDPGQALSASNVARHQVTGFCLQGRVNGSNSRRSCRCCCGVAEERVWDGAFVAC